MVHEIYVNEKCGAATAFKTGDCSKEGNMIREKRIEENIKSIVSCIPNVPNS